MYNRLVPGVETEGKVKESGKTENGKAKGERVRGWEDTESANKRVRKKEYKEVWTLSVEEINGLN